MTRARGEVAHHYWAGLVVSNMRQPTVAPRATARGSLNALTFRGQARQFIKEEQGGIALNPIVHENVVQHACDNAGN